MGDEQQLLAKVEALMRMLFGEEEGAITIAAVLKGDGIVIEGGFAAVSMRVVVVVAAVATGASAAATVTAAATGDYGYFGYESFNDGFSLDASACCLRNPSKAKCE